MNNTAAIISCIFIFLCCIHPVQADEWNITVKALFDLEPVTFGYSEHATDNYDFSIDEYATRPDAAKVTMALDSIFRKSIKREELTWSFNISVPPDRYSYLLWNVSGTPESVILVQRGSSGYVDMKRGPNVVSLTPGWHEYIIFADAEANEPMTKGSAGTGDWTGLAAGTASDTRIPPPTPGMNSNSDEEEDNELGGHLSEELIKTEPINETTRRAETDLGEGNELEIANLTIEQQATTTLPHSASLSLVLILGVGAAMIVILKR